VESGRILRWRLWEVKEFTAEEGNVHHEEEGTVDRMNKMDRIEKKGGLRRSLRKRRSMRHPENPVPKICSALLLHPDKVQFNERGAGVEHEAGAWSRAGANEGRERLVCFAHFAWLKNLFA